MAHLGVSENSVPHCTQWFCWSLSLWKMAISLGILTQHFQTNPFTSHILWKIWWNIFQMFETTKQVNWVNPFSSKHPIVHHLEGLLHCGAHAHVAHVQRIAVLRELREHVHHEGLRGDGDLPGRLPFPEEKRGENVGKTGMIYHGFTMYQGLMMVFSDRRICMIFGRLSWENGRMRGW